MKKKIVRKPVRAKKSKGKIKRTPVRSPLILTKKDPSENPQEFLKEMKKARKRVFKTKSEFLKTISNEVGYIETLTETNLEPTKLYDYQKRFINDRSKYRHSDKSRQIGQSYGFSCEGYAKSQLMRIYTAIFISYNQEEANEKIVYARALHESVPYKYKKKLVTDRITALEFEGTIRDGRKTKTRLISHPQREPRGKGFNTDVFLDEIAHYQWPEKVYVAAVPIVTRGYGQLSLASSPLGKGGLHYEIGHDTERYSMFSRHKIYWWDNPDFLNEKALQDMELVRRVAPTLTTQERVLEFGNDSIIQAFYSMTEEDFQQEYEITPFDESISYYPMELINQCTFDALRGMVTIDEEDEYGENPIFTDPLYPGIEFHTYDSIESLSHAIAVNKVKKLLYAGFDVGRDENNSEVIVLEELPNRDDLQIVRLMITMKKTEFRRQFKTLEKLFHHVPIRKLKIDSTGLGSNISEDLRKKFHSRVEDVKFTNENKQEMAKNLKLRFEDRTIAIPMNRDLIRQIHSVKRVVSANNSIQFKVEKNRLHHGDKFWSLALASSAGKPAQMYQVKLITANVAKSIRNSKNLVKLPKKRIFKAKPVVIGGVDFKHIPPPPKHLEEFSAPPAVDLNAVNY